MVAEPFLFSFLFTKVPYQFPLCRDREAEFFVVFFLKSKVVWGTSQTKTQHESREWILIACVAFSMSFCL